MKPGEWRHLTADEVAELKGEKARRAERTSKVKSSARKAGFRARK